MPGITDAVARWAGDIVSGLGPAGVGLLAFLETVFPPIPSELVLPMAGFLAAQGRMSMVAVIVASTLGSLAGALVLYRLGLVLGRERIERGVERYGRYLLLRRSDVEAADARFQRHERAAVFFGRMIPGVRSLISVPAGVERMPIVLFLVLTAAGSAAWNGALVAAGAVLGANHGLLEPIADLLAVVVSAAVLVMGARFVLRRRREAREESRPR
jgi:membrane protein DedA with SNARE-associated domain